MRLKRCFFLLLIVLITSPLTAQEGDINSTEESQKITFYYNESWELTTPEKYVYKREAMFDLQDMLFNGVYSDFNKDGRLIAEGLYDHGAKRGLQTEYYNDGAIKSTIEFSDWDFIIWQMMTPQKEYMITRGTGRFTINFFYYYDLKFKEGIMTGEFLNGKRVGTWVYTDMKGVKTDVEHYNVGKLSSRYRFARNDSVKIEEPKEVFLSVFSLYTEALLYDKEAYTSANQFFERNIAYSEQFQRNVSYPGSLKRLLWLLSEESNVPDRNLILIKMKIDEHGQVLRSTMVRSVDETTDNRVMEALKQHESRFLPAFRKGRPIATTIYLPVASGEEWLKTIHEMPIDWFLDFTNFTN